MNGEKTVGGMLHADSIEDAARRAIGACELTIKRRVWNFGVDTDFINKEGKKVYLSVSVHPEYFLDCATVETIDNTRFDDDGY